MGKGFWWTVKDFIEAVSLIPIELNHDDYVSPRVIKTEEKLTKNINGSRWNSRTYPVITVEANSAQEAADMTRGQSMGGEASISVVRVGRNRYEIRVEEWDNDPPEGWE